MYLYVNGNRFLLSLSPPPLSPSSCMGISSPPEVDANATYSKHKHPPYHLLHALYISTIDDSLSLLPPFSPLLSSPSYILTHTLITKTSTRPT